MLLQDLIKESGEDFKVSSSNRYEYALCCPFCIEQGESQDSRYRLGINIQSGFSHCFNCSWRSGSVRKTAKELSRVFGITLGRKRLLGSENVTNGAANPVAVPSPTGLPMEYEPFTDSTDMVEKKARAYLRSRNISLLQIVKHKIGYAAAGTMSWRILFPVMDASKQVFGIVGRSFGKTIGPKYLNSPGLKMLWGTHVIGKIAIISEGITDALQVERALYSTTTNHVSLARLGSTITNAQLAQLKQYEKVIILPDRDHAGIKGAKELASAAYKINIPVWVSIPEVLDLRDPGSMDEQEICEYIASAQVYKESTDRRLRVAEAKRTQLWA